MTIKYLTKAGLLAAGCALSVNASALVLEPVATWSASVSAAWDLIDNPPTFENNGGATPGTPSVSATSLTWGPASGSLAGGDRSGLVITDSELTGVELTTNGGPALTSTITHFNNVLPGGTDSLLSATVLTTLTLTPTSPAGDAQDPLTAVVPVRFFETDNASTPGGCGFESVSACDDIFVLVPSDLTDTFVYEDFAYTTTISADGLGPLTESQCGVVGIEGPCFGLTTQENADTPVQFFVSITANPVPVPATLALMGLGLLGFGASVRRQKRA